MDAGRLGEELSELFAAVGPLRVRRMFGGAGVYAGGAVFALVAEDRIYLKADAALAARLAAEGSAAFVYARGGRSVALGYWRLPGSALDDPEAAGAWAEAALSVARRAGAARR